MYTQRNKGFIKYIVLFIILIVLIATFDIDVKAIVEHPFVQDVFMYIKVVLSFVYDAFEKVIGQFQSEMTPSATSTTSTSTPAN